MTDIRPIPKDQIRIFSREGNPIAQINAHAERSWVVGDEGRALFTYASRDVRVVAEEVLQFGNWILIENSEIPIPWVGVIDTPRRWSSRALTVHCYDPVHVFGWRRGGQEATYTAESAGSLCNTLLTKVNEQEATILRAGTIWTGGKNVEVAIRPAPLTHFVRDLVLSSGEEYQWRPVVDTKGRLTVYMDWAKSVGVETSAIFQEGKKGGNMELVEDEYVEDGPIENDVMGYGDGATWDTKPKVTLVDDDSRKKYGLRQTGVEFVGVSSPDAVRAGTQTYLDRAKNPAEIFNLAVINRGDTFKVIGMGNRVRVVASSVGFHADGGRGKLAKVRILGAHYDPALKTRMSLTVQTEVIVV